MSRGAPNTFYVQVRDADGWRNITSYGYDPRCDDRHAAGRDRKLREARIGLNAWRNYHEFQDEVLRIAECVLGNGGRLEWVEVTS